MAREPLTAVHPVTELLLLTLIFAGLPLVSRADEHVTLDFIDALLGDRGRQILRRLVDVICGLIILGLAWRVWVKAGKIAGLYCANAERAVACAKRGVRFLAVGSDLGFLRAGTAAQIKVLKG